MAQPRFHLAVDQFEGNARQPNSVEISLQDCRKAEVPDRGADHQPLGRLEPFDVRSHQLQVFRIIVIDEPVVAREHRIELLFIEVAAIHRMPGLAEALDGLPVKRLAVTFLDRVRVEDENPHEASIRAARPGKR